MTAWCSSTGLSVLERLGCTELLLRLPSAELAVLAAHMRPSSTREEAVAAILDATTNIRDLLQRRPITCELIQNYLDDKMDEKTEVSDKTHGVKLLLQLWHSNPNAAENIEESVLPVAPAPSRNTSFSSLDAFANCTNRLGLNNNLGMGAPSLAQILRLGPMRQTLGNDSEENLENDVERSEVITVNMPAKGYESSSTWSQMEESSNDACSSGHTRSVGNSAFQGISTHLSPASALSSSAPSALSPLSSCSSSSSSSLPSSSSELTSELTHSFVCWFYELIRSQTLTSDAFWSDASTRISLLRQSDHQQVELVQVENDGQKACNAIVDLLSQLGSFLRPMRAQGGIDGDTLIVNVDGGVVKIKNDLIESGRFEQQFGLARDTHLANNWRIKFTLANIVVAMSNDKEVIGTEAIDEDISQ